MFKLLYVFMLSICSISNINCNGLNESDVYKNCNEVSLVHTTRTKSLFTEDDDDGHKYYVFTTGDFNSFLAFKDLRQYFYDGSIDIENLTYDYLEYLPIRQCSVGRWDNFDYASGYPYGITYSYTCNYVGVKRINTGSTKFNMFAFFFMYDANNLSSYYEVIYAVSTGFDYMISSVSYFNGAVDNPGLTCIYGDTGVGYFLYPTMLDIFASFKDRWTTADYDRGWQQGYNTGIQDGYNTGYTDGVSTDATASTIFTGILDVGLLPVNVFLTIFNFEVFGINIAGIVSGLLTISVVIIIFRFLFGGKKDD